MAASYASSSSQSTAQPTASATPTSDSSARVQKRAELRGRTFDEQEAMLAPSGGADAQVQASGAKGTETPIAAAPAPEESEESGEPSLRPVRMTFTFDRALLERGVSWEDEPSKAGESEDAKPSARSVIGAIANRVHTYERTQCKDGARLTPEEILCLAVQTMWEMSVDIAAQRMILYQLFFGHHSPKHGDDYILTVQPSGGNVTLGFSTLSGDYVVRAPHIEPLHFSGPAAYQGIDDNQRESRVVAADNGYKDHRGNKVSAGAGSVMTRTTPQFLIGFTSSPEGRRWKDVPVDQLEAAPGFEEALLDYRHNSFMYTWVLRACHLVTDEIVGRVGNPPHPLTEAWVTAAVRASIDFLTKWNNPELLAEPHAVITPEDEAVIRRVIAGLCPGVVVNLDADANGGRDNIQIEGLPKAPAGHVADPVATARETSRAVIAELYYARELKSSYYARLHQSLPAEEQARLAEWDLARYRWNDKGFIKEGPSLPVLIVLLEAWQALADAQSQAADTAAPQAALDAAVATFKG